MKKADLQKVHQVEQEIYTNVLYNCEKYQRPVHAFVTFQTQEAYERCLSEFSNGQSYYQTCLKLCQPKNQEDKLQILGSDLILKEATEPSDIIWENLATDEPTIFKRQV